MTEARPSRNRAWLKLSFRSLMLLGSWIVFPVVLSAQSQRTSSSAPVSTLNEQQRKGEGLFFQNCSFCHLQRKGDPKIPAASPAAGPTRGPVLSGVFRGAAPNREEI